MNFPNHHISIPKKLFDRVKEFPANSFVPFSLEINGNLIGGLCIFMVPQDLDFFKIERIPSPEPALQFRRNFVDTSSHLIEFDLWFDNRRKKRMLLQMNPLDRQIKDLFDLFHTGKEMAFCFCNLITGNMTYLFWEFDEVQRDWIDRNSKIIRKIRSNPGYIGLCSINWSKLNSDDRLYSFDIPFKRRFFLNDGDIAVVVSPSMIDN